MGDGIDQSKIWTFVGCVSAINGLVCFAFSSTYNMSFGKLGFAGHFVYLLVGLMMCCFVWLAKEIPVPKEAQGRVAALIFVVICLISVVHDKFVPGKSDALSIISYGSFALMSLSISRTLELGFEIGFSAFFLQLFAAQLFKIHWSLLLIALFFCFVIIMLRHRSESGGQSGSSSPNVSPLIEDVSRVESDIENRVPDHIIRSLGPPGTGSMSHWDSEQIDGEEEDTSPLVAESWGQDHVSSVNNQSVSMPSTRRREVIRRRMTPGIQSISRWGPPGFIFFQPIIPTSDEIFDFN